MLCTAFKYGALSYDVKFIHFFLIRLVAISLYSENLTNADKIQYRRWVFYWRWYYNNTKVSALIRGFIRTQPLDIEPFRPAETYH